MAVSLLKIVMHSTQPTTTSNPTVSNFFYQIPAGGLTNTTFTITDTDWLDDGGDPVAANGLVPVTSDNGFASVTYNGQLQEADVLTSLTAAQAVLDYGATPVTLDENKWLVLTVTNFAPSTTAPVIS